MTTTKELIVEIRRIIDERPDVRYRRHYGNCNYNSGECSDGTIGCVFGQAFRNLGLDGPIEGCLIRNTLNRESIEATSAEINWCNRLQIEQDGGKRWGDCLKSTEQRYKMV